MLFKIVHLLFMAICLYTDLDSRCLYTDLDSRYMKKKWFRTLGLYLENNRTE